MLKVIVTEIDPICALQAAMEGFYVKTVEDTLGEADIYVTATGNKDVITLEHMQKMKDQAIVCNIGHFDNEIQVDRLDSSEAERTNIKDQVDRYTFESGNSIYLLGFGRLVNLGCATGHPSFVMSNSFANQTLAQIDLWKNRDNYEKKLYTLPKHLDEEVARLHLSKIGCRLTTMSNEQADYIGVSTEGHSRNQNTGTNRASICCCLLKQPRVAGIQYLFFSYPHLGPVFFSRQPPPKPRFIPEIASRWESPIGCV